MLGGWGDAMVMSREVSHDDQRRTLKWSSSGSSFGGKGDIPRPSLSTLSNGPVNNYQKPRLDTIGGSKKLSSKPFRAAKWPYQTLNP